MDKEHTSPLRKLLRRLLTIIGSIFIIFVILLSTGIGLNSIVSIVIRIISIAGGGSVIRGIILAPFFVFGVVQLFRSFCLLMEHLDDSNFRLRWTSKKSCKTHDLTWLYFPLTLIGYLAVFTAIFFAGKA